MDKLAGHIAETGSGAEDRLRKLTLDNEDLRFECSRLKTSLERAQAEILDLTERSADLQRRLDRIHRLAPRGSARALAFVRSLFGRG